MTPAQLQALRLIQGIAPAHPTSTPDAWEFKEFLLGMTNRYHSDVSTYDSTTDLDKLVQEFELSLVTLYDHMHGSDECCSVDFLLLRGLPLAGWKKVGDHSDYSDGLAVFNETDARALAMRVWKLVHEASHEDSVNEDTMDVLQWAFAGNSYVTLLNNVPQDMVAYAINSPHWMLGRLNPSTERLFVINSDDTLTPIVRVVSTATSPSPYGAGAFHRTTVELQDNSQREVETQYIVHAPLRTV